MRFFAIVWIVIKQVINNLRLEVSLLAGLIVAVAVVSSIPTYTNGALQYVLTKRWVESTDPGRLPNTLMFYHDPMVKSTVEEYEAVTEFLSRAIPARFGEPIHSAKLGEISTSAFYSQDNERGDRVGYANIRFLTNLFEMVDITDGRLPSAKRRPDGAVEAVVDEAALDDLGLLVGQTYVFPIAKDSEYDTEIETLKVQVVGTFKGQVQPENASQWLYLPPFEKSFFVSEELFLTDLALIEDIPVGQYVWYLVLDHTGVRVDYLERWIDDLKYVESRVGQLMPGTRAWKYPLGIFEYFQEQAYYLKLFMFSLSVPILGMVLYFVVLAAGLTVRRRRTEIAMLRSRGAGVLQIALAYLLEWGLLGLTALAIGPYLGLLISKAIGAASGFLSFVDRRSLPAILASDAYVYGGIGLLIAVAACLVPVLKAARHSIVTYKRDLARSAYAPAWQRYFVDFLLLGISYYGYRMLSRQAAAFRSGQVSAADAELLVDPQLFLIPIVFVLAAGLFTLRVLPLVMKLLNQLTSRWGGVSVSMTVLQMARNPGQYNPLLLLLIITVAAGIYSAATARTLDQNFADRLAYQYGADIVLREQWQMPAGSADYAAPGGDNSQESTEPFVFEPPFYVHKELPGVAAAAKVLRTPVSIRVGGNYLSGGTLVGIEPAEYAGVGWFRKDLAPNHLYEYLNLLIQVPEGALVPTEAAQAAGLRAGDWISARIGREDVDFMIVGTLDYWPTVYEDDMPFMVTNLDYIQQMTTLQPYDVWLQVESGFNLQSAVEHLREEGIWVISVEDLNRELVQGRQEPQRMGLYGMLSTGFIVAVLITVMGFFLHTFLSLRSRLLQFGVLRTIGLSVWQLIAMLSLEQLLSVGLGLLIGLGLGQVTGELFLPFIQLGTDLGGDIPPFTVVTQQADVLKIVGILGVMLIVGLVILAGVLSRMRLHQAVKLGEEL